MYQARIVNGTNDLEKEFRNNCKRNGDDIAILTSEMTFSYIAYCDVKEIMDYGWSSYDLEEKLNSEDAADKITRLAAWIRECGEYADPETIDDESVDHNKPMIGYELDDDGNYPEVY